MAKTKPNKAMPATKRGAPASTGPISDALLRIIRARGLTAYRIAIDATVSVDSIQKFLNGERGLSLKSADKIAAALGLVVVEAPAPRRSGR